MTKKKSNKKNIKKTINRNIIYIVLACVVLLIIILLVILLSKKKLECSKVTTNGGFNTNNAVTIYYKNNTIKKMNMVKKLRVSDKNSTVDYLSMISSSMDDAYRNMNLDYDISNENNELSVTIDYKDKKKYILDNIYVEKEAEGISFNVIKEDTYGYYATFDLSKEYSKEDMIKIMQKANYTCK